MEASKAEGKRSFKYMTVEEEEEEDEEDVGEPGLGEDEKKRREMTNSTRRASGTGSGSTPIACQADNCNADLSEAKHYHRRHKVCELHAKAPAVQVAGLQKRFCQQCSRFHVMSEFDEAKRSCRRRLAGHNERRRKSASDQFHREGSN